MTSTTTKPRKWIAARIAELDPDVDWIEIHRLMTTYQPNDFVGEMVYSYAFPHFVVPFHGAEPVWREGESKVVDHASLRSDDTLRHNVIWMYYGPHHPETKRSVDTVNKLHAHYAKSYPENFSHHEDYVYVWCFSAALMHRIQVKLGLPGFTETKKIVAHRFWAEMAPLFVVPGSGEPIQGYPDDFDGILAWLDEFEGRDFAYNEAGARVTEAVVYQLLHRRVPRALQPIVRAFIYSMFGDSVIKASGLRRPHPVVSSVLRRAAGVMMGLGNRFSPDPTESALELRDSRTDEELRQRRSQIREEDASFGQAFRSAMGTSRQPATPMTCPHPMGQRAAVRGVGLPVNETGGLEAPHA